jgi:acyl transferase domain-containing protein
VSGIEVVGRACRLPGANGVEDFWRLLTAQRCSVTRVPEERFAQSWYFNRRRGEPGKSYTFAAGVIDDIWGFDPAVFSITPREARQMDPQQRLVLQLVWEALEDAGIAASSLARRNIGVYVGASSMDHSHRQYFDPAGTDSYLMTGNTLSLISNRVSYQFDLTGPSITVDTACSSSLVALDYAMQDLKVGKIDAAIVGGVNGLLSPFNFMGFCAASMLSPDGLCRAFDHRANGYVRSEGGVIMVLQRKGDEFARHRVHGEILASAMNSDGRTSGVALPSMEQQAELLRSLYKSADIDPARLAFVEAHGTGTPVGDPVECHALGKALGEARSTALPLGSVKSNVGHLEPASGMVGLLKAQLSLERGVFPATLHVEARNPNLPFDAFNLKVVTEPVSLADLPASQQLAGVNNFGFGGTNVHVIIGPARQTPVKPAPKGKSARADLGRQGNGDAFVLLSAQCRDGLATLARRYVDLLEGESALPEAVTAGAIGNAVIHRRDLLPERLVVAAKGRENLCETLRAFADGASRPNLFSGAAVSRSAKTAFVFSGNGAQWAGMGRAALARSRVFSRHFKKVDDAYRKIAGISLKELIHAEDLAQQLSRTEVAQPLLFAIQVALAQSLIDSGMEPAAVVGHSVGEVAAAHISGALDLQQAVAVIRARSHHQEIVRGRGRMAAVQASQSDVEALIADAGLEHVVVAAINSPRSVTVAGDGNEVSRLIEFARTRHVAGKLLDIQYPFHSARLDPARQPIIEALAGLQPRNTGIPFYSTVSGALIEGAQLDADYWWRNVREPVRFHDAICATARDGSQVYVEIGPRPILMSYIADCVANTDQETRVVPTFEPADDKSDVDPVSAAIGRALVAGIRFDTDRLFGPRTACSFDLPLYPWQNKAFRMMPSSEALATFSPSHIQHPLLGVRLRGDDVEWESQLDTAVLPYLADHKIGNRAIMPGTAYVEMALAGAINHLNSERIELRDIDFVQALELSAEACQEVHTRVEPESRTISVTARARLSTDARRTHMRTRYGQLPSEVIPVAHAPLRETSRDAPPREDLYRLAARFQLNYGPAFQRMTACREIGDDIIEVELSEAPAEDGVYVLHPVDFDACLHGLNIIYNRLDFGENKLSFVPVRIGSLRVFRPRERIDRARIKVARYSTRGAVAAFELFGSDGALIATAEDVRLKAASLVHRLKLGQAAYHIGKTLRVLPADSRQPIAPQLDALRR